ncbi:MAG TPA: hypothetical protein VGO53_00140, partial [Steroidobacteraceae bacterium]|nr:hypothetical protein [Steroidobacteraceae bacterium]
MKRNLLTIAAAAAMLAGTLQAQAKNDCDRGCLENITNQYLAAMLAHDASKAPFTKNVKFTENATKLPLTEGLWFTATALTDYKVYVADPQGGAVAFIGLVQEHTAPPNPPRPVLLALRLKVNNHQISEAESVVVRTVRATSVPNLQTPRPALSQALSPAERSSRAQLIKVTNLYFDGIEAATGANVPFDAECNRLENGMRTAGPPLPGASGAPAPVVPPSGPGSAPMTPGAGPPPGFSAQACADGFNSGIFAYITAVQPRRVLVVDEERGITFGVFMFQHRGITTVKMHDGSTRGAPFDGEPVTMPMAELFKIKSGKIRDVEAVGIKLPYGMGPGWD